MEICVEGTDTTKKAKVSADRNTGRGDRRSRLDVRDSSFTVYLRSTLMEVKERPMLKQPQPMTPVPKPYNACKHYEFHK